MNDLLVGQVYQVRIQDFRRPKDAQLVAMSMNGSEWSDWSLVFVRFLDLHLAERLHDDPEREDCIPGTRMLYAGSFRKVVCW